MKIKMQFRVQSGFAQTFSIRTTAAVGVLLTIAISGIARAASYDTTVMNDNPHGYWRLGDASGTAAINQVGSPTGENGVYLNSPTLGATGVSGTDTAVTFNGTNQFVRMKDSHNPTDYTIESWVKFDDPTRYEAALWRSNNTQLGSNSHALRNLTDRRFQHHTYDGSTRTVTGTTLAVADQWYHVVGVYHPGAKGVGYMSLYVNGVREAFWNNGLLRNPWTGGDRWMIAKNVSKAANPYLDGTVDEAAVYHSTLGGSHIFEHYSIATGGDRWITDGGAGNWSDGANWEGGSVPNAAGAQANLTNDITSDTTSRLDVDVTLGALTINDSGTLFNRTLDTTTGSTLTMNNGGSTARIFGGAGNNTIATNVTLADDIDISVDLGGTLTQSGQMTGSHNITLSDVGTLALAGGDNRLPTTANVTFTGNGTLDVGGTNQTVADISVAHNVTATFDSNGGSLVAGVISQPTNVTTTSNINGTLSATTYYGAKKTNNYASHYSTLNVNDGGTATFENMYLSYNGYDNYGTVQSTINVNDGGVLNVSNLLGWKAHNSGGMVKVKRNVNVNAGGRLNATTIDFSTQDNNNTTTRSLTLNGGTLANLPGTDLTVDPTTPITLTGSGTFDAEAGQSITTMGVVKGGGDLIKTGDGTLILRAESTYGGSTMIDAGTFLIDGRPAAYYSFDNTSGTTVYNDGTLPGKDGNLDSGAGLTTSSGGHSGEGMTIADDSNQRLTVAGNVDLASEWTVASWFNNLHPVGQWRTLSRGSTTDHQVIVKSDSNDLGAYVGSAKFRDSGFDLLAGQGWHHVAAVGSGTTTDMYIDGVLVGTSDRKSTTDVKWIGNHSDGQPFAEVIDDFQVFQRALSAAEVLSLYSATGMAPMATNAIPDGSPVTVANGATLELNYANETIGSLAGSTGGQVLLGGGTLTTGGNDDSTTFAGIISGTGGLNKEGTGAMTLTGDSTYTGTTTISAGTLILDGTHTGTVGDYTVDLGAMLAGSGSTDAAVVLNGSISPGTGVGTLSTADNTWNDGSRFLFDINDAEGTSGDPTGWDLLDISGSLDLSNLSPGGVNLDIASLDPSTGTSGDADNFAIDPGQTILWDFAHTTDGITGFELTDFTLDASAFTNSITNEFGVGIFSVLMMDNNLYIAYTAAAPEPSSLALATLGLLGLGLIRWRRRRTR